MSTVGTIEVIAKIDTSAYKKGASEIDSANKNIEGSTTRSTSRMNKSIIGVGKVGFAALAAAATAAVASITAAIPSAVKRIDTLNNSVRTFDNMGFSSEQSAKSIRLLEKSIMGLPTPLDSAMRGMTSLAATYGDVSLGQKVFTSLNNAILGFGGTAAEVDNAIHQLSQLPMDGPLDAQTWMSLRNSGLTPVLVAMAKESGMSVSEMKEAFGEGELTVQDFTDRLIKMNKEGGGGLKSLEKIAKDSTSGIGTSFANMRTSIVRSTARLIEAIGTERINKAIKNIGDNIGYVVDAAVLLITGDYNGKMFGGQLEEDSPIVNGILTIRDGILNLIDVAKLLFTGDFNRKMFGGQLEEDSALVAGVLTVRDYLLGVYDAGRLLLSGDFKSGMFGGQFEEDSPLVKNILDTRDFLIEMFNAAKSGFDSFVSVVAPAVSFFRDTMLPVLRAVGGYVLGELSTAWRSIMDAWTTIAPLAKVLGTIIGVVLVGALVATVTGIAAVVTIGATLINWIIQVGKWFIDLWANIINGIGQAIKAIGDFYKSAVDNFSKALQIIKSIWSSIPSFFSAIVGSIGNVFASIPGRIRGFFVDAFNAIRSINWVQVGADIIAGIVRGLNPGSIVSKMKEIASSAMDTVKSFLGIKSPSRVFMAIGGDIMAGWAKGLDAKPVVSAMDSATNQLMSAASPFNDISTSGTFNVVGGNKAFDGVNGSSTQYNIGTITIASEVDGERWLRRLSGDQEIVSNGLVPTQSYM